MKNDDIVFKFGISKDELQRENQHKLLINSYVCFYVVKCSKNNFLEDDFKLELKRKQILKHFKIGTKNYTELFVLNDKFTMNDVYSWIENWIKKDQKNNSENLFLIDKQIELAKINLEIKKLEFDLENKKIDLEILKLKSTNI